MCLTLQHCHLDAVLGGEFDRNYSWAYGSKNVNSITHTCTKSVNKVRELQVGNFQLGAVKKSLTLFHPRGHESWYTGVTISVDKLCPAATVYQLPSINSCYPPNQCHCSCTESLQLICPPQRLLPWMGSASVKACSCQSNLASSSSDGAQGELFFLGQWRPGSGVSGKQGMNGCKKERFYPSSAIGTSLKQSAPAVREIWGRPQCCHHQ